MEFKMITAVVAVKDTAYFESLVRAWLKENRISPQTAIIKVTETPVEDDAYNLVCRTVYIFYVPMFPM